jgi:prolyl-tRNA editing enzyme YbaK/EbsC (Cys-tRNA(Pro) deacylase)
MSISKQLADYLRRHGVSFLEVPHAEAFVSADVSSAAGLEPRELAKLVALRDEEHEWLLAVVPGHLFVDLDAVQAASGRDHVDVASEIDIVRRFGARELGGAAAFDALSGTAVYLDESFGGRLHIYFADGSGQGVFALRLRDYIRLARPILGPFASGTRQKLRSA